MADSLHDRIQKVLSDYCTGFDDHDPAPCYKCSEMQKSLESSINEWFGKAMGAALKVAREAEK
jgi:hypothetical protein